jgi:hypothetical protein
MTTLAATERALLTALGTIRDNWAALVEPLLDAAASVGTEPVTGGGATLTATEARISLRHEATLCLSSWARVVVDDRHLTKSLPLGHDTLGLIELLQRHAGWMSGHLAGPECSRELTSMAARVKDSAEGNRVAKIQVGRCPETVWVTDDEMGRCPGNLWATIRYEESMIAKEVTCDGPEQHKWAPHEWASLGRRVLPPKAGSVSA